MLHSGLVMKKTRNPRPPEGGPFCRITGLFICNVTDRSLGYAGNEWKITNCPLDRSLLPPREPCAGGDRGSDSCPVLDRGSDENGIFQNRRFPHRAAAKRFGTFQSNLARLPTTTGNVPVEVCRIYEFGHFVAFRKGCRTL